MFLTYLYIQGKTVLTATVENPSLGTIVASGISITGFGRYTYNQDEIDIQPNFLDMVPGSLYLGLNASHLHVYQKLL